MASRFGSRDRLESRSGCPKRHLEVEFSSGIVRWLVCRRKVSRPRVHVEVSRMLYLHFQLVIAPIGDYPFGFEANSISYFRRNAQSMQSGIEIVVVMKELSSRAVSDIGHRGIDRHQTIRKGHGFKLDFRIAGDAFAWIRVSGRHPSGASEYKPLESSALTITPACSA